jgi:hypothetical protein
LTTDEMKPRFHPRRQARLADTPVSRAGRRSARRLGRKGLVKDHLLPGGLHVIAYRATLDVPRELAWFVAKMLLAER